MRRAVTAILALSALVVPTLAYSDAAEDAIDARRGFYQVVKFNAGQLFGMAKGEVSYSAEAAKTAAENLVALSEMNTGAMWPQGSDNVAKPGKTRALPAIWQNLPDAGAKNDAFAAASRNLLAAAPNGLDALRGSVGALGQSCKGCHDNYRAKTF